MSRFSSDEVYHAWAHQTHREGSNGTNVDFRGDTLYSYGHYPIARLILNRNGIPQAVLHVVDTYSTTTAGHCSRARSATSHLPSWRVPNIRSDNYHRENLEYLLGRQRHNAAKAARCLTSWSIKYHRDRAIQQLQEANEYRKRFLPWRKVSAAMRRQLEGPPISKGLLAKIQKRLDRAEWKEANPEAYRAELAKRQPARMRRERHECCRIIREAIERAKNGQWSNLPLWHGEKGSAILKRHVATDKLRELLGETRRKAQLMGQHEKRKVLSKALAEWLQGKRSSIPNAYGMPAMLRLNGDRVETSQGAKVGTRSAKALYLAISSGRDVSGMFAGPYRINGFDGRILTAGCHRIPMGAIRFVARQAGW